MKIPRLLCVLSVSLLASALAEEAQVKDIERLETEARKQAANLTREAADLEKTAITSGKKLTEEAREYIELTRKEAMWAEKTAEAWGKNQKRLAENYAEKVRELCEKRGPLTKKIYPCTEEKSEKKKTAKDEKAETLEKIERQQAALEEKKQKLLKNEKTD